MAETLAYARKLAEGPPVAIQLAKQLVRRSETLSFVEGLNAAQHAMTIAQSTEDSREGPLAFREKRAPRFTGR
jgi:enoyl-CoA hydratase